LGALSVLITLAMGLNGLLSRIHRQGYTPFNAA
jgi:hypothetical protein